MRIEEIRPSQIPQDWYDELIGIDLETEDKYLWSPICMCSLYKPKSGVIYVVPIKVYRNGVLEQLFKQDDNEFRTFIDFISRARIVGHNLQFDCAMIQYQWGVKPKEIVWDTYLVARVLQLNTASLKDLILQIKPEMVKIVRHFKDIQYGPPFRYDIGDVTVLRYSALERIIGNANTQFMMGMGEHYLHVKTMLAMMRHNKVLYNNKKISLYDSLS